MHFPPAIPAPLKCLAVPCTQCRTEKDITRNRVASHPIAMGLDGAEIAALVLLLLPHPEIARFPSLFKGGSRWVAMAIFTWAYIPV